MTRKHFVAIAAVAFVLCYARVLASLVDVWLNWPVYSYGFAVPLISAYVLSTKRRTLRAIQSEPSNLLGIVVIVAAVLMLIAGQIASVAAVQHASMLLALAGMTLLFYGRRVLAAIWFPFAYLFLAIPVWNQIIARLQLPSQILSGGIATRVLRAVGIPALHEGTNVILPHAALDVMQACSGVNQLIGIVVMAMPAAYLMLNGYARRVAFIGLAVVIAYLSNGLRIALVGFLAEHGLGDGDLRSMHLLEGLAVSALGYLLLFGCLSLLSRVNQSRKATADDDGPSETSQWPTARINPAFGLAAALIVLAAGVFPFVFAPVDVRLVRDLRGFPTQVGDWRMDDNPVARRFPAIEDAVVHAYPTPTGERHFEGMDDELVRVYRNVRGDRVQLYIGYQRTQRQGKKLAGDASNALEAAASSLAIAAGASTITVSEVLSETPRTRRQIVYWFDLNGRVVSRMYLAKAYTVWDALTRRRTNGAVVMVASEFPATSTSTREETIRFAEALLPLLSNYLPS